MATNLEVHLADGTTNWAQWPGGYGSIWVGYDSAGTGSHYTFGGGTLTLEISDSGLAGSERPMKYGYQEISLTARDVISMYLPPCYVRSKLVGATSPNIGVMIKDRNE